MKVEGKEETKIQESKQTKYVSEDVSSGELRHVGTLPTFQKCLLPP
jgi:hypothetical protein